MGRDGLAACLECRRVFVLGYGSYSTWLDFDVDSVTAFDNLVGDAAGYRGMNKNQAWRQFLVEHEAHRHTRWSSDWAEVRAGGALVQSYDGTPVDGIRLDGFSWFERDDDTGAWKPLAAGASTDPPLSRPMD